MPALAPPESVDDVWAAPGVIVWDVVVTLPVVVEVAPLADMIDTPSKGAEAGVKAVRSLGAHFTVSGDWYPYHLVPPASVVVGVYRVLCVPKSVVS